MPTLVVNGANIQYEEMGEGIPIILTPGARYDMNAVRGLAEQLASEYRVIIYDRRNCGASDVIISGDLSEQEIWADDLYEILHQLQAIPAYIGGGSAGCRVSLMLAIRHPESVKGLLLWHITGGSVAAEQLGYSYYEEFIEIAKKDGMQGVIATDFFAERIRQNPSNLDRLVSMHTGDFISVMERWRTFFTDKDPVIGSTKEQLDKIAVPAVIIPGDDDVHPLLVGQNLHSILNDSELHSPVWSKEEEERLALQEPDVLQQLGTNRRARIFLQFLSNHESQS